MKKTFYKESAITVISLVITIIILLILSSITLRFAIGNEGLIKRTQKAAEEYKVAETNEVEQISSLGKELHENLKEDKDEELKLKIQELEFQLNEEKNKNEELNKQVKELMEQLEKTQNYEMYFLKVPYDATFPTRYQVDLTKVTGYRENTRQIFKVPESGITPNLCNVGIIGSLNTGMYFTKDNMLECSKGASDGQQPNRVFGYVMIPMIPNDMPQVEVPAS